MYIWCRWISDSYQAPNAFPYIFEVIQVIFKESFKIILFAFQCFHYCWKEVSVVFIFRVPINCSKLYHEKFLQNFTSFSFTQMHTMVVPKGQEMPKFFVLWIAGKCIFQCKLRYLIKATLQDLIMEIFFGMRKAIKITWSKP